MLTLLEFTSFSEFVTILTSKN